MAYGIGQQLDEASKLSIAELVKLQSVDPSLIYTLALQEKQKLEAAALTKKLWAWKRQSLPLLVN